MFWKKLNHFEINTRIQEALGKNLNFRDNTILGIPASYLDDEEFYDNTPILEDAPFLTTLIANPNHIGCHTLTKNESEPYFRGTQQLEIDLLRICAEEIFKAEAQSYDGYVSPGGTEANIQAMWVYRNYFMKEFGHTASQIALVYSADSHYSMPKGANILGLQSLVIPVEEESRKMRLDILSQQLDEATNSGIKHFIIVQNLATTMFGSIDPLQEVTGILTNKKLSFKLHVDGAFGGFVVPFVAENKIFSFQNKHISSFTLDGHKMLQAPYGTGIFLIRKGLLPYVETPEASYVHGKDFTICGSRSGANAVAVWMNLMIHGSRGWTDKVEKLIDRSSRLCRKLDKKGISYYRNPMVNIIAIKAEYISEKVAEKYHLVADDPASPKWWKIVVMDHVAQGMLDKFVDELTAR